MNRSIKESVTVKPGGIIEICHPDFPVGVIAEVTVKFNTSDIPRVPITSLFGKVKGCFNNCEEADAFLRAERDSWE